MAVSELSQRIVQYLFRPARWAQPKNLVGFLQQKPDSVTQVNDVFLDLVAKSLTPTISPPFFDHFAARLTLLDQKEWQQLGLAVALLPYSGKISRSMDGHFRKAVRELANPELVAQIEALDWPEKPVFTGSWSDQQEAINGAIAAIIQVANWPMDVRDYTLLRFEALPAANIEQLTIEQVEALCKISLPNHSWL